MKITKATFYLSETEPQVRQVRYADRGGIDKVPPGLSGLFTHCEGIGPEPDLHIEYATDEPVPMYRLQLVCTLMVHSMRMPIGVAATVLLSWSGTPS